MPLFGAHLSIAGGLYKAADAAAKESMQTVQIFTHSPSQWAVKLDDDRWVGKPLADDDVRRFKDAIREHQLQLPTAHDSLSAEITTRLKSDDRLNPFAQQLPPAMQEKLAARYAELFSVFLQQRAVVKRVTLWGVTDADSWLNNWPVAGRTSYPLLFDRAGKPKAAFDRVIAVAQKKPLAAATKE